MYTNFIIYYSDENMQLMFISFILIGLVHILTYYIKQKASCTSVMELSSLTMIQRRNYISSISSAAIPRKCKL